MTHIIDQNRQGAISNKKAVKLLIWAGVIVAAAIAIYEITTVVISTVSTATQPTARVLECGTEDDKYDALPLVGTAYLTAPTTNCWSRWQVMTKKFQHWRVYADRDVKIQKCYGDGSQSTPFTDKPTIQWTDNGKGKGGVTGFRFKNPGPKTVNITIQLWR